MLFESSMNYYSSINKLVGVSTYEKSFSEKEREKIFIELTAVFGKNITDEVKAILSLCNEARQADNDLGRLLNEINDEDKEQLRNILVDEYTNDDYEESKDSMDFQKEMEITFASYDMREGRARCNFYELKTEIESLDKQIREKIVKVNNKTTSSIKFN